MLVAEDETQMTCDLVTMYGETFRLSFMTSDFASAQKFKAVLNKRTISLCYMGSDGDLGVMQKAIDRLRSLEIGFEVRVLSAHRTPEACAKFCREAEDNGFGAIIAAAGKAAHLAGAAAANTVLPVIGVPVKSSTLDGLDALLSTVQMPSGIPVATVAIDGADNAAILAAQILAGSDGALRGRLKAMRREMTEAVEAKDRKIREQFA